MILYSIVHVPALYQNPFRGMGIAEELYSDAVLGALQDIEASCVLLVDAEGNIRNEIDAALEDWPQKHRMKMRERLSKLARPGRRRIIEVQSDVYTPDSGCGTDGCSHAVGIASAMADSVTLIGPPECWCRGTCAASCVTLNQYRLASLASNRRGPEGLELADREWDRTRFAAEVWEPLFRYAKHIKIIDRWIGRQFEEDLRAYRAWKNSEDGRQSSGLAPSGIAAPTVGMRANFSMALEWIFGEFIARSAPDPERTFEVICALDANRWSSDELGLAAQALRTFAAGLSSSHGLTMTVTVKLERQTQLRHARVLFTDHVKLLIERGHDLLHDDGVKVRDVMIKYVSNPDIIEREVSRLDDCP
jgi:hypothetical protein